MASIVVSGDTSGAITLQAPAVAGSTTLNLPASSGTLLTTASTTGANGSAISTGIVAEAYGGTGTSTGYYAFKNRLINGNLDIWQRGTSFTGSGTLTYFADRWSSVQYAGSTSTVSRQASGISGIQYCIRVQRPNAATNTATINLGQSIESVNCLDLAGQSVTISFYARAGANFSSASSLLRCAIYSGTGTDQNLYTGYTGSTDSWQENTLTTSWQKFTFTRTIPSNATEVGVAFYYTPVGTAGANDYYEIAQVQLEKGATATSFDYRPYGTELQLCRRYYQQVGSNHFGATEGTTAFSICVPFIFPLRVTPTLSVIAGNIFNTRYAGGDVAITTPSVANVTIGNPNGVWLQVVTSGRTNGITIYGRHQYSNSDCFAISAEL